MTMNRLILHGGPPTEDEQAFDDALAEMNKLTAHIPTALPGEPQLCQCPCHFKGSGGMMHFTACCHTCPKCSQRFSRLLAKHVETCTGNNCTECRGSGYKFEMEKWGKEPFDPCPRCGGSKVEPEAK